MSTLEWTRDRSSTAEIEAHLTLCDQDFRPSLSTRVDIAAYATKLAGQATRLEAWDGAVLVGLVAVYANAPEGKAAFITNVSVVPRFRGQGIAERLMKDTLRHVKRIGRSDVTLEVHRGAVAALALYASLGFEITDEDGETVRLARSVRGDTQ